MQNHADRGSVQVRIGHRGWLIFQLLWKTLIGGLILPFGYLVLLGCESNVALAPLPVELGLSGKKKKDDGKENAEANIVEKKIDFDQRDQVVGAVPPSYKEAPPEAKPVVQDGFKRFKVASDEKLLDKFPRGEEQFTILCNSTTNLVNVVRQKFCVEKVRPKSLVELQTALGLAVTNPALVARNQNGTGGNPAFAFQGHSSSLVGAFVSSINPRVVIMTPNLLANNTANPNFVVMGFVRGEQLAELIANDTVTGKPEFYLFSFRQACNDKPTGCTPGDLLTPAVESNWTEVSLYRAEELANTIVDCFHCHRPSGTTPMLRMQELRNPWTHWFRDNTDGQQLIADYYAAHGTAETYGGIPGPMIRGSDPQKLENLVRGNGFAAQPNEFQTATIRTELTQGGTSATYNQLQAEVLAGRAIPIPFVDLKVTEPALLTKYTQQYQNFLAGTVPLDRFEDHRDIFLTDPVKRSQIMGYAVAPGTSPKDMLMLACNQCHHSGLDQSLSRAKFNVDFTKMTNASEEITIAIERLKLGYSPERLKKEKIAFTDESGKDVKLHKGEHPLTMPPRRIKVLTDEQIDQLVQYLEQQKALLKPN